MAPHPPKPSAPGRSRGAAAPASGFHAVERDLQPFAALLLRDLPAQVPVPLRLEAPRRERVDRGLRGQARPRGARAPAPGGPEGPGALAAAGHRALPADVRGRLRRSPGADRTGGHDPGLLPGAGRELPRQLLPRPLPLRPGRDPGAGGAPAVLPGPRRADYRIQGFVDRIARAPDGAIEIQDYKTSARVPSRSQDRRGPAAGAVPDRAGSPLRCRPAGAPGLALPAPGQDARLHPGPGAAETPGRRHAPPDRPHPGRHRLPGAAEPAVPVVRVPERLRGEPHLPGPPLVASPGHATRRRAARRGVRGPPPLPRRASSPSASRARGARARSRPGRCASLRGHGSGRRTHPHPGRQLHLSDRLRAERRGGGGGRTRGRAGGPARRGPGRAPLQGAVHPPPPGPLPGQPGAGPPLRRTGLRPPLRRGPPPRADPRPRGGRHDLRRASNRRASCSSPPTPAATSPTSSTTRTRSSAATPSSPPAAAASSRAPRR